MTLLSTIESRIKRLGYVFVVCLAFGWYFTDYGLSWPGIGLILFAMGLLLLAVCVFMLWYILDPLLKWADHRITGK